MTNLSQKNLLKLAQESKENGDLRTAIQDLEEALRSGHSISVTVALSKLYRQNKEEDQAYALLKEEPDLFSSKDLFNEYIKVLAANRFLIEALEVEHVSGRQLPLAVKAADLATQKEIMTAFRRQRNITQADYEQLLKLDLLNFRTFAQSLLLERGQNFAVRLALCEDLVRLGLKEEIKLWVLDQQTSFIPADTNLLVHNPIYKEVIAALAAKFRNNPSQLPVMLGEANLVLGSLYPRLQDYVDDPDAFSSDLVSFLEKGKGRGHQKLLQTIYRNLPE